MLTHSILKAVPLTVGLLCIGACATTTPAAETTVATAKTSTAAASKPETVNDITDKLSQTRTTSKSADGEVICKRTSVIGSNFKRKVCATAGEWEARSAADKKTTAGIQRSAGPGTTN